MTKTHQPSVGVIGLGIIGSRVAATLRREGISVFVWNRSPRAEPNFLASPSEVAEAADILQIFVRDGAALLEVLRQLSPALTARHLVLNHATVSPEETLEAAALVERRGAQFLDAPFTGSRDAAAEGKLVYYIGGCPELLKKVTPILKISSQQILMMGPIGAATYVKIATNLILAAQVEAAAEALEFLNLGGIPLQRLGEALQHSAGNSAAISMKLPQMLQGDFEPRFSTKNMLKDLQFALDIVERHGVAFPATAATAAALRDAMESGLGDADYSAVASHYGYSGKVDSQPSLAETPLVSEKRAAFISKKSLFSFLKKRQ